MIIFAGLILALGAVVLQSLNSVAIYPEFESANAQGPLPDDSDPPPPIFGISEELALIGEVIQQFDEQLGAQVDAEIADLVADLAADNTGTNRESVMAAILQRIQAVEARDRELRQRIVDNALPNPATDSSDTAPDADGAAPPEGATPPDGDIGENAEQDENTIVFTEDEVEPIVVDPPTVYNFEEMEIVGSPPEIYFVYAIGFQLTCDTPINPAILFVPPPRIQTIPQGNIYIDSFVRISVDQETSTPLWLNSFTNFHGNPSLPILLPSAGGDGAFEIARAEDLLPAGIDIQDAGVFRQWQIESIIGKYLLYGEVITYIGEDPQCFNKVNFIFVTLDFPDIPLPCWVYFLDFFPLAAVDSVCDLEIETPTPTPTSTFTATATSTNTSTPTPTNTPTDTPTNTATSTGTNTATATATDTVPPTATATGTGTATNTSTSTPTATATTTATSTSTATGTTTSTSTSTPTVTATDTATATTTSTVTSTATLTATTTATATGTSTPTGTTTSTSTVTSTTTATSTVTNTTTGTIVTDIPPASGTADERDFGDLPESYGDASHEIVDGLYLGSIVDAEDSSTYTENADGDDLDGNTDDEDGVTVVGSAVAGQRLLINISATNTTGDDAYIFVFVDLNLDGDFDDRRETIVSNLLVPDESNNVIRVTGFNVPTVPVGSQINLRVRLSSDAYIGFTGLAQSGEVEDHTIVVQ